MDTRNDIEELIDRYVTGGMTPDEQAAFEERMRCNPGLTREAETVRHIANAVERRNEQEAFDELAQIGSVDELKRILNTAEQGTAGTPPPRNRLRRLIPFAAAAAAVLAFVWIGMRPEYASKELYDRWYETPEYAPAVSRGGTETSAELERLLDSAAACYTAGKMDRAVLLYDRGENSGQEYPDHARFYRAAALAAGDRSDEAIRAFRRLAEDSGSEYAEDAAWQLALEYLRSNDRARARECLESLISKQGPYAADARKMLGELDRKKWF